MNLVGISRAKGGTVGEGSGQEADGAGAHQSSSLSLKTICGVSLIRSCVLRLMATQKTGTHCQPLLALLGRGLGQGRHPQLFGGSSLLLCGLILRSRVVFERSVVVGRYDLEAEREVRLELRLLVGLLLGFGHLDEEQGAIIALYDRL